MHAKHAFHPVLEGCGLQIQGQVVQSDTVGKLERLLDVLVLETGLPHRVDHVPHVGEARLVAMVWPRLAICQEVIDLLTVDFHHLCKSPKKEGGTS